MNVCTEQGYMLAYIECNDLACCKASEREWTIFLCFVCVLGFGLLFVLGWLTIIYRPWRYPRLLIPSAPHPHHHDHPVPKPSIALSQLRDAEKAEPTSSV